MDLRTVDVAICTEVSTSYVRELSNLGLLGSIARQGSGNRRFFDPRVVPIAYLWKTLRNMELLSAQQMEEIGAKRKPETSKALFTQLKEKLGMEILYLQSSYDMLDSYITLIEEGQSVVPGEIEVRTLPERAISYSHLEHINGRRKGIEHHRFAIGQLRRSNSAYFPTGYAYNTFYDLMEKPDSPTHLVSYDPQGTCILPAGTYLVGHETKGYDGKSDLHQRMYHYAMDHKLEFCASAHVMCLLDAASVTSDQFLFQTMVLVRKNE